MTESQIDVTQEQRPLRMCDVCGQVDDHPRHIFAANPGQGAVPTEISVKALQAAGPQNYESILRQVMDDSTIVRHMDCCREAGCPGGSCNLVTDGAEELKGLELAQHLVDRGPLQPDQQIYEGLLRTIDRPAGDGDVVQGEVVANTEEN